MKKALVYGASSEIGKEMIKTLKQNNSYWVKGVDLKEPSEDLTDEFILGDLTKETTVMTTMFSDTEPYDEVYQFTEIKSDNTADGISKAALININTLNYARRYAVGKVVCLSANNKFTEKLYSSYDKDKKVKSFVLKITSKTSTEDIVKDIQKDNKKSFKKLGKL